MEDGWHYIAADGQKGPLTLEQMRDATRSGLVLPSTLVWRNGMAGWEPAEKTDLVRALELRSAPPAMTARAPVSMAADSTMFGTSGQAISFSDAIKIGFAKFVTWRGRANRPEFWYFILFTVLVYVVAGFLDAVIFGRSSGFQVFSLLAALALVLPSVAVAIRRLHDTDKSGWWYWIAAVPLVGGIVFIVFMCQAGSTGPNRFG